MNEAQIIEQAKNGDQDAISWLYNTHKNKLFQFIYSRIGAQHDAEDLFQDVMLGAFDSLDRFRGEVPFLHWCYQIARNKIKMFWRDSAKHHTVEMEDKDWEELSLGSEEDDDAVGLQIEQIREKIESVLEQLPENYAQILRIRFYDQKTLKECAEVLQITLANAKVLQHRALKKAVEIAHSLP